MSRSFEELVTEAAAVDVSGWDFSWLDGRATEERPPWGYSRLLAEHLARAQASLDIQTGGGEVLAGAGAFPRLPSPLSRSPRTSPPQPLGCTRGGSSSWPIPTSRRCRSQMPPSTW